MTERNLDRREADRLVKAEDAGRAAYLKRFHGIDHELPTHFDLVVNTDVLTVVDAVNVIVTAAYATAAE